MKLPLTLISVTAVLAASASGEIIACEGFDYGGSDNANLSGMTANGGVGWAGGSS